MASSTVTLSTIDRVLNYTPPTLPSFLPQVCVTLADETDTTLDTVELLAETAEGPDVCLGGTDG